MKLKTITGNGTHFLVTTSDTITGIYIPSSIGGATINVVAIGTEGYEYAIPDGTGLTTSKSLFTGKDVPIAVVVTGYTADFNIEVAQ